MRRSYLPIFFLILSTGALAQDSTEYQKTDTLLFYAFAVESTGDNSSYYSFRSSFDTCQFIFTGTSNTPKYFANCQEISKERFESLVLTKKNLYKCKPCMLNYFDDSGKIVQSSMQYTDCFVGDYYEYYPNGALKVKGSYKKNYTGKWKSLFKRGYCSIKDGVWTYYSEERSIIKTETYKNNVIVK